MLSLFLFFNFLCVSVMPAMVHAEFFGFFKSVKKETEREIFLRKFKTVLAVCGQKSLSGLEFAAKKAAAGAFMGLGFVAVLGVLVLLFYKKAGKAAGDFFDKKSRKIASKLINEATKKLGKVIGQEVPEVAREEGAEIDLTEDFNRFVGMFERAVDFLEKKVKEDTEKRLGLQKDEQDVSDADQQEQARDLLKLLKDLATALKENAQTRVGEVSGYADEKARRTVAKILEKWQKSLEKFQGPQDDELEAVPDDYLRDSDGDEVEVEMADPDGQEVHSWNQSLDNLQELATQSIAAGKKSATKMVLALPVVREIAGIKRAVDYISRFLGCRGGGQDKGDDKKKQASGGAKKVYPKEECKKKRLLEVLSGAQCEGLTGMSQV